MFPINPEKYSNEREALEVEVITGSKKKGNLKRVSLTGKFTFPVDKNLKCILFKESVIDKRIYNLKHEDITMYEWFTKKKSDPHYIEDKSKIISVKKSELRNEANKNL